MPPDVRDLMDQLEAVTYQLNVELARALKEPDEDVRNAMLAVVRRRVDQADHKMARAFASLGFDIADVMPDPVYQ